MTRYIRPIASIFALTAFLLSAPAFAQQLPDIKLPTLQAPPKPYKKVEVTLPPPVTDPSFETFRKQLGDIAQRKDRAALAALIAPQGFFWERENGNAADEKKSGIDNFAAATGVDAKDGSGWEFLSDYASEPSAAAVGDRPDMICAPATASFTEDDLLEVIKATDTTPLEWGYPLQDGIEVRESAKPDAQVVDKLGLHFVRVMVDDAPSASAGEPMLRIVAPSGKVGYVPAETLLPIGIDQLCYVKQDGAWKIIGYIGEGGGAQ
jgi:hypothetical protein